jgi:hypothetical protein
MRDGVEPEIRFLHIHIRPMVKQELHDIGMTIL